MEEYGADSNQMRAVDGKQNLFGVALTAAYSLLHYLTTIIIPICYPVRQSSLHHMM